MSLALYSITCSIWQKISWRAYSSSWQSLCTRFDSIHVVAYHIFTTCSTVLCFLASKPSVTKSLHLADTNVQQDGNAYSTIIAYETDTSNTLKFNPFKCVYTRDPFEICLCCPGLSLLLSLLVSDKAIVVAQEGGWDKLSLSDASLPTGNVLEIGHVTQADRFRHRW